MNKAISLLLFLMFSISVLAAEKEDASKQSAFLETGVTSNFVEHGVSQSQNSWALQGAFGYRASIARVGLWGSSVQYPDGGETLNLRPFFDVLMDVTPNNKLLLRYNFNRYFQSSAHNGSIVTIDDKIFTYHVKIEQNTNFEGTGTTSTWFGFSDEYEFGGGYIFNPEMGYTEVGAVGFQNYFDLKLAIGTKVGPVYFEGAITDCTAAGQFNGRGGVHFLVSAVAKY